MATVTESEGSMTQAGPVQTSEHQTQDLGYQCSISSASAEHLCLHWGADLHMKPAQGTESMRNSES